MEVTEKTEQQFEQYLMEQLADSKLEKTTLRKYSSMINQFRRRDLLLERILRYGQPFPDGLIVQGRLPIKDAGRLADFVNLKEVRRLDVFPKGIIHPDWLDISIQIGEDVANQSQIG